MRLEIYLIRIHPIAASVPLPLAGERQANRSSIRYQRNAAVKRVDGHDLRRAYGLRLARAGVSPYELQKLMRHADIKTSMEFYIDLSHEDIAANLHR